MLTNVIKEGHSEMADEKKNWFAKHKVLTVILAFIVIGVIASAASGGGNTNNNSADGGSSNNSSGVKTYKFDERADKQKKDVEVMPGETATVGGVTMTVSNVEYKTSLNDFE